MEFCVEMNMLVQDAGASLATRVPITVQVFYRSGCWQAQCTEPPLMTGFCETLEEALKQAAKDAAAELTTAG